MKLRIQLDPSHLLLLALIVAPFLYWLSVYMNLDLWYDEVYTLYQFVLVPLTKTITDYHVPNNHVFYNIINNFYLSAVGMRDMFKLMDSVYLIRIPPLFCTLATVVYLYLLGKRFFNTTIAYLCVLFLVTTLPFYNIAVQVRGYSLSVLLLSMVLYYLWSLEERFSWTSAVALFLSSALALYTIPSNLLFLAGVFIFYFIQGVRMLFRADCARTHYSGEGLVKSLYANNTPFFIIGLLAASIFFSAFLYSPVLKSIVDNQYVKSYGMFSMHTLTSSLPQFMDSFISQRYFLVFALLGGFAMSMRPSSREITIGNYALSLPQLSFENQAYRSRMVLCAIIVLTPFLISFIRADSPPLRVFTLVIPAFVVLLAFGVYHLIARISFLNSHTFSALVGIILYCHLTFFLAVGNMESVILSGITSGRIWQEPSYNYYQAYYHPLQILREFSTVYVKSPAPVIAYDYDLVALPTYLSKFNILAYQKEVFDKAIFAAPRVYVITSFPNNFTALIEQNYTSFKAVRLNKELDYNNIFLVEPTYT